MCFFELFLLFYVVVSKLNLNGGNGVYLFVYFEYLFEVGSLIKYFTKMFENNCSVGKARWGMNGKYVIEFDECVSWCGGNCELFLIGVVGGMVSGKMMVCDFIM